MRAYGKEIPETPFPVRVRDRQYKLAGFICDNCDYEFFVPALPEHEPSYCPNCSMKFCRGEVEHFPKR